MNWLNPVTLLIDGVVNIFKAKQERKKNRETAAAKLTQAKEANQHEVTLTDAEGEAVLAEGQKNSWKDEYVTIIITFPIVMIVIGTAHFGFTGDTSLMDSGVLAIQKLTEAGVDMGFLMNAVVLTAVGLKIWRK